MNKDQFFKLTLSCAKFVKHCTEIIGEEMSRTLFERNLILGSIYLFSLTFHVKDLKVFTVPLFKAPNILDHTTKQKHS